MFECVRRKVFLLCTHANRLSVDTECYFYPSFPVVEGRVHIHTHSQKGTYETYHHYFCASLRACVLHYRDLNVHTGTHEYNKIVHYCLPIEIGK